MPSAVNNLITSCQRKCKLNDAYVILYESKTGEFKLRKASAYDASRKDLLSYIDDHSLVVDPKSPAKSNYRIVFYGDKELADDLWERFCQENNENQASRSAAKRKFISSYNGPAKRTRTINEDNYTNNEIISCFNKIYTDLGKIDEKIDDIGRENKEVAAKSMIGRDDNSNELSELLENWHWSMKMLNRDKDEFDRKFSNLELGLLGLREKSIDSIRHTLRHERYPSKLVGDFCLNLFGEKLKTHILGTDGKRERARRPGEREFVFDKEDEGKLRKILSIFGKSFVSPRAWKLIVQASANQKGRDLKNKPPKKGAFEAETETVHDVAEDRSSDDVNPPNCLLSETIYRQKIINIALTQEENDELGN